MITVFCIKIFQFEATPKATPLITRPSVGNFSMSYINIIRFDNLNLNTLKQKPKNKNESHYVMLMLFVIH